MNPIEAVYLEIQPKIYLFFYVRTFNHSLAEDLTQDVFYAAFKGLSSFKGDSSIDTWIFSIAQNLLKKHYRSKKYRERLESHLKEKDYADEKSLEDLFIINEDFNSLLNCIQALDDLPKEIVILRSLAELSFKQIGQLVNKSENYVRVTFHRTKIKLQLEMEAEK